ncbi:hypothetical protein [Rhodobium gokarnense]|uniref:Uncharacterized protein n=1 Tax=Rhodobium gokarnense TaxID=364296 RepID=A0ABT3H9L9_9HYPH|nr:hypothetical protein [Rhodobium gokarnense]MCW2306991.1 hypothetical protein [Rhodobium gokarnense]
MERTPSRPSLEKPVYGKIMETGEIFRGVARDSRGRRGRVRLMSSFFDLCTGTYKYQRVSGTAELRCRSGRRARLFFVFHDGTGVGCAKVSKTETLRFSFGRNAEKDQLNLKMDCFWESERPWPPFGGSAGAE